MTAVSAAPAGRPVAGLRGQAAFGLADQVLVSLGNLGIGLVLIRLTSKEQYGLYILGFGVINLVVSLNAALVTVPMTVLAHGRRDRGGLQSYCAALLRVQLGFGLVAAALGALGVWAGRGLFELPEASVHFGLALAFALPGVLLQEFLRRYHFLEFRPQRACAVDALALAATLAALGLAVLAESPEKHVYAMAGLGAGGLLSGLAALAWSGLARMPGTQSAGRAFRDCWSQGRWALLGAGITWVQNQSYAYFLSFAGALAGLAEANAARLLLAPLPMLNSGLGSAWMPRLAKLRSEGRTAAAERESFYLMAGLTVIFLGYTALVWAGREILVPLVLGDRYAEVSIYIWAWAAVNILTVLRANSTLLMQAFCEFKAITLANFWSALLVVSTTLGFIRAYGTLGSLYALAAGELVLGLLLWQAFLRARARHVPPADPGMRPA